MFAQGLLTLRDQRCLKSRGYEEIPLFGLRDKYLRNVSQRPPGFVFELPCKLPDLQFREVDNYNTDPRDFKKILY
jgi:hypothetical protein